VVEGQAYRWCLRYDGLHWDKGFLTQLAFTIHIAAGAGQRLLASLWCSRRQADGFRVQPFTPRFVRDLLDVARAAGWQPVTGGLEPFSLEGIIDPHRPDRINFISQDLQTGGCWLNVTVESEEDFADLEARVHANIGYALAQMKEPGSFSGNKPIGLRFLCVSEPASTALDLLARIRADCASYDLSFSVATRCGRASRSR
jgi:hypothetical protein